MRPSRVWRSLPTSQRLQVASQPDPRVSCDPDRHLTSSSRESAGCRKSHSAWRQRRCARSTNGGNRASERDDHAWNTSALSERTPSQIDGACFLYLEIPKPTSKFSCGDLAGLSLS